MKRTIVITLAAPLLLALFCVASFAQSQSRDVVLKELEAKHAEIQAELKKIELLLLEPSEEDGVANFDFLQKPDTGLVRLLPREIYDSPDHAEKRLTIHGGGSYYSFTRLTHEYGWGTQIGLEQGELTTSFAGADFGMLANLGDVPIESLNLEHPIVKSLAAYTPPSEEANARTEYIRLSTGESVNGTVYKTRLPAVVNSSYILRGIHYSDSDVLIVFRVTSKDTDGSTIIVWKLLKKYPKPELARDMTPR
jgi:hypothetical protein